MSCNKIISSRCISSDLIRCFSSNSFLFFFLIFFKWHFASFKSSFLRFSCRARKINNSTMIWIVFQRRIYQIEIFNSMNKTILNFVNIYINVISMLILTIVLFAHSIICRFWIQLKFSLSIIFDNAFTIDWWSFSINSLNWAW